MRIALISDIHGNLISLEAVLKDINRTGADQIVFLGDAATLGPQPKEVLAMLQELNCTCIQGNHDEYMVDPDAINHYTKDKVILENVAWCRDQLSEKELNFLATFQMNAEIPLNDKMFLICFHGSPLSNTDIILSETPASLINEMFMEHEMNDIFAGGHTHIQMLRQFKGHYIINPGSVGQPFSEFNYNRPPRILPWAEYAVVNFENNQLEVDLKRVNIDKEKIKMITSQSGLPMKNWLYEQYV
jgi:putative phosphoesterase